MANEFIARKGLIALDNSQISGSLNVSGNVGIGLSNPGTKLDVIGRIRAKFANNSSNISFQPDFAQVYLVASSADNTFGDKKLVINSSGISLRAMGTTTAAMEITNTGNVGIGTASPGVNLDINGGNSTPYLRVFRDTGYIMLGAGLNFSAIYSRNNLDVARNFVIEAANVGIGTESPSSKLEVGAGDIKLSDSYRIGWRYTSNDSNMYNWIENSYSSGIKYKSGSWTSATTIVSHDFQTYISGAWQSRLQIIQNGNILIGTAVDDGAKLQVNGNLNTSGWSKTGRLGSYGTYNSTQVQGIWSIQEDYLISLANNNFGNQYGLGYAFSTTGGAPISGQHQILFIGNGVWNVSISVTSGEIRAKGDIIAFSTSDKKLKDNLTYIPNALKNISKLGGYTFDWNNKQDSYNGKDYGIVAQEVEELFPEMVQTRDNGYKAVKYDRLIPVMIEAIKELNNKIQILENK